MSALIGVFSHSFGSVIPCGFAFLLFFYRPLHTFSGELGNISETWEECWVWKVRKP